MTPSRTHLTLAERHARTVQSTIERDGYHASYILGTQFHPDFAYTTGRLLSGQPELLILGLDHEESHHILWHLGQELRDGVVREPGRDVDHVVCATPIRLLPVPVDHWGGGDCLMLGFSSYYGPRQFPVDDDSVLQLVWPDADGSFPWDDDVDPLVRRDQPILADGEPPERRWPLDHPVDNRSLCSTCCSEPRNRAERRRRERAERRRR